MSRFTDALHTENMDVGFLEGYEDAVQRETLIKTLVQMRKDGGLRQEDVAQDMGVGQSTVSQLENATDPRISTVQRYARAVGAQVHFVAATRTLQPKEWVPAAMIQPTRTSTWKGIATSAVRASGARSTYAKAA